MSTLNGNKIVTDFVQSLNERDGFKVNRTSISRNVFELSGSINCLLYVKAIAHFPYKWGVTANVVNELKRQTIPWIVVLLFESHEQGYLLSSPDVEYYILNIWPIGRDGDYKPAAAGSYLAKNRPFSRIDEFLAQLNSIIIKPFSIESALEEAKKEVERVTRLGIGESDVHKNLKNYVARYPNCIGLNKVLSVSIEYLFPSGDRVDIAIESVNNQWTVVEIEIEGLTQTLTGLFQAIKYKALQDAVLKSRNIQGSVEGILVAKSIPLEIRSLAKILDVKTFEVTL
jgi:hypothetical protein